ncbi:guanosine polyphosphate pyrophosphohydrolase/synthase [Klebsormidium nitens]|uniref:GTP diphosphokinase n=1 Tax=Klebsormidium nitens TaxID=105231 RepID=A0A1Y1IMU4_KLENI|nr:guanosine polyphosphate pyrophosphohydrolase/synthase [Klebsormidium nitens]|eukprot:GAQ89927.1 guanosine polyphosphate pyrophosphohydrolase/synthase [Klebsormidium nitens]
MRALKPFLFSRKPSHTRQRGVISASAPVGTLVEIVAAGTQASNSSGHVIANLAAVANVALTAVAVAATAYLSPYADGIAGRHEEKRVRTIIEGVDVTGFQVFAEADVKRAIDYAKEAHKGQMRRTGEPYITHCIHTALILAALVPAEGSRAVNTIVAGVLHDVLDDTNRKREDVKRNFGEEVAGLVAGVSRLSHINQLLRRHRRTSAERNPSTSTGTLTHDDVSNLRVMLLGMINDPRMVLIKLADRLHNMRTIYALPPSKAAAVAQETLAIWCSLAARLGVWGVKAELEDLCFAVLQPELFRKLRAELADLWTPERDWRFVRRQAMIRERIRQERPQKQNKGLKLSADGGVSKAKREREREEDERREQAQIEEDAKEEEEQPSTQDLLKAVVPFNLLTDQARRGRQREGAGSLAQASTMLDQARRPHEEGGEPHRPKVIRDAAVALAALGACEDALSSELLITQPYVPGMEVTLSGRLKSLYSAHCKMRRKGVSLAQIYDARALRVVVGDGNGTQHVAAVEGCYDLLRTVHGLWPPIGGEFDDYIVNPKPTGYQSLHTAVIGPDGAPLEVQIRTQSMHEQAEYGVAAHWMYKESGNMDFSLDSLSPWGKGSGQGADKTGAESQAETSGVGVTYQDKYPYRTQIREGHPALRIDEGRLLAAVVVRAENDGRNLLVAVSFALGAREAVAAGRTRGRRKRWETYAKLHKLVGDKKWTLPGHGDWTHCLERYTLCSDGIYHKEDAYGHKLPTFVQMLELSSEEEEEYGDILGKVAQGIEVEDTDIEDEGEELGAANGAGMPTNMARLNNKVRLLRSMLQWEREIRDETVEDALRKPEAPELTSTLTEVLVIRWPDGEIVSLPAGSSAEDLVRQVGETQKIVIINGKAVTPNARLKDGDLVELR